MHTYYVLVDFIWKYTNIRYLFWTHVVNRYFYLSLWNEQIKTLAHVKNTKIHTIHAHTREGVNITNKMRYAYYLLIVEKLWNKKK